MDLSAFLFSLGLLMVGVWLIFAISGDFKERGRRAQGITGAPRRHSLVAARHMANLERAAAPRAARPQAPPPKIDAPEASPASVEQAVVVDPFQGLNAAFVREIFEKFKREL